MKYMFVFSALIAASFAAAIQEREIIPILHQESEVGSDGNYQSSYETANGIKSQERGTLKNPKTKDEASEVTGSVEYLAPDGSRVFLEYLANEFGFQVRGDHLPVAPIDTNTPPPIPEAILRSLEYNAAHPEENEPENQLTKGH